MTRYVRLVPFLVLAVLAGVGGPALGAGFSESRIYIEYNASANDLGFHVSLDGEDWSALKIINPAGVAVFEVATRGGYKELGLTELFFEGAEPSLDDVPLNELLARFPEGRYKFSGVTVTGGRLVSTGTLSHAIPAGPSVSAEVDGDLITIRWEPVVAPPPGFPNRRIEIVGYQVLVDPFAVTLPADSTQVTLPLEFAQSLRSGSHPFEVLAIDVSGNQTITEGTFETQ